MGRSGCHDVEGLCRRREREPARHGRRNLARDTTGERDRRADTGGRLCGTGRPLAWRWDAEHPPAWAERDRHASDVGGRMRLCGVDGRPRLARVRGRWADGHDHGAVRDVPGDEARAALQREPGRAQRLALRGGVGSSVERPTHQQLGRPDRAEGPAAATAEEERGHAAPGGEATAPARRNRRQPWRTPGPRECPSGVAERLRSERRCHLDHRRVGDRPERRAHRPDQQSPGAPDHPRRERERLDRLPLHDQRWQGRHRHGQRERHGSHTGRKQRAGAGPDQQDDRRPGRQGHDADPR